MRLGYLSLTNAQETEIDCCCTEGNWAANYKQDNNFSSLLELGGEYKSWQEGWDEHDKEAEEGRGGIFNLEIIISGLVTLQALSDCFS